MTFDFDGWRARYDEEDQAAIASRLWYLYPTQRHFDATACGQFLDEQQPARVLEIGGYDGELAALMLEHRLLIKEWTNVDICEEARANPRTADPRYGAWSTWDAEYDALIMSHSAEHMRWRELLAILTRAVPPVRAVYLAAPLPEDGTHPNWDGYEGTHILEVGWQTIDDLLVNLGLTSVPPRTGEVRCWATA